MREEALIYFDEEWLSTVIDLPEGKPKGIVIISHGLSGDRVGPQRLLVSVAENLAQEGFAVCRFDYRDAGDSSGAFSSTRISKMEEDLLRVISQAKTRFGDLPTALIGFSLGAIPCVEILPRFRPEVLIFFSAALTDPPPQPKETRFSFRDGTFYLDPPFFAERARITPRKTLQMNPVPSFLFYGDQDEKVKNGASDLKKLGVALFELKGVGHLFESYPAREELSRQLIPLCKKYLYEYPKPNYSLPHRKK